MVSAPTKFVEIVKFRFGAPVVASDGISGLVDHVVVDSTPCTLTHVGVKLARFTSRAYSVPMEMVVDARADMVQLNISRDEIHLKAEIVPGGYTRLNRKTTVSVNGRRLGRLAQVSALQPTLALHRFVVDRGVGRGEVLVPVEVGTLFDTKRIDVTLDDMQAKTLTDYRPDDDLLQEVSQALYNYPRLRVDLRAVVVRAMDGEVWLRGHVSSDLNSRLAQEQLQGIDGLAAIHNELIADTDLAAVVAAALARDPRTREQHIGVYPKLGDVYLRGVVHTPEAREAAGQIANAVPGVEKIVNELVVRPGADVVPTLASVTGQEDQVPGGD